MKSLALKKRSIWVYVGIAVVINGALYTYTLIRRKNETDRRALPFSLDQHPQAARR